MGNCIDPPQQPIYEEKFIVWKGKQYRYTIQTNAEPCICDSIRKLLYKCSK